MDALATCALLAAPASQCSVDVGPTLAELAANRPSILPIPRGKGQRKRSERMRMRIPSNPRHATQTRDPFSFFLPALTGRGGEVSRARREGLFGGDRRCSHSSRGGGAPTGRAAAAQRRPPPWRQTRTATPSRRSRPPPPPSSADALGSFV